MRDREKEKAISRFTIWAENSIVVPFRNIEAGREVNG